MNDKHLDYIQSAISRMSGNCFIIKGWCITLVAALCAISVTQDRNIVYLLAYIPTVLFSLLDAYYLWIERRFRELFQDVVESNPKIVSFNMDTKNYRSIKGGYFGAFWSTTVAPFYLSLAATIILVGIKL